MINDLGLPEGRQGELCQHMPCPEEHLVDGGPRCNECRGLTKTVTLTLTEMEEWKRAVADLTARAEKAESECDTAIREVSKYAQAAGKAEAALKEARKEVFEHAIAEASVFCPNAECYGELVHRFTTLAEKEG